MSAPGEGASSLTQVVHAKMVALDWLRFAGSARAHVPWWREADSAWRSASVHAPPVPAAAAAAHAQPPPPSGLKKTGSKPTRVASHIGAAHACTACAVPTTDVLYLSHVSHPHWSICSNCSKSF